MIKPTFLAIGLLVAGAAAAQDADGTWDVYFEETTVEGKLEGCMLVFTSVIYDHAYKKGAKIVVNGSVALRDMGADWLLTGKLGTRELEGSPDAWSRPNHFYFSTPKGSTAQGAKMFNGEAQGYKLSVVSALTPGATAFVTDTMERGQFVVGFNRKPGGIDVKTTINMNVALKTSEPGRGTRVKNEATQRDWGDCVSRLAGQLKQRLEPKPKPAN